MSEPTTQKKIFSLGYRCSSAGILKKLQIKYESFPFDWMISSLPVIKHCLETDFQEFLHVDHYKRRYANTYEMRDSKEGFICHEYLMVNSFYQPPFLMNVENAYQFNLAMNHHNIINKEDYDYYNRCVGRFRELMTCDKEKIYVHIRHLITQDKYNTEKQTILKEFTEFDEFMSYHIKTPVKGLIFIMVRGGDETYSGEINFQSEKTGTKIYTVFANRQLVDAGEIFLGNCNEEIAFIEDKIKESL